MNEQKLNEYVKRASDILGIDETQLAFYKVADNLAMLEGFLDNLQLMHSFGIEQIRIPSDEEIDLLNKFLTTYEK